MEEVVEVAEEVDDIEDDVDDDDVDRYAPAKMMMSSSMLPPWDKIQMRSIKYFF